jgi:hypothetical protein
LNIFRAIFSIVPLRHALKRTRSGVERSVHLLFTAAQAALAAPVPAKYNKGGLSWMTANPMGQGRLKIRVT